MDFHNILAKPIQIVKEVLDLEPDLESPSLASQFVAIRHQLAEVQQRLNESHRIAHEKDVVIAKLQKAMAARVQRPSVEAIFTRREEKPVPAPPVAQTEPAEELKLPPVPCYQAPRPKARVVRTRVAAKTTASPAQPTARPRPSARAAAPAKAEKTRSTRTRVAAKKTGKATQAADKPKKSARAGKSAPAKKAKPTRARTSAKKPATKTRAKATAKPKRAPRARKS